MSSENNKGEVFLISHHHSDLVWRRTKKEYNRIREEQILHVLSLLEKHPEFRFTYAQSDILRTFMRDFPECEPTIKALVATERIELVGGGVSIPDMNLSCGEALLRNFMYGKRFYQKKFSREVNIAWLMDAFGMSGQIPQILAKLGFKYVYPGRMPGLPGTPEFGKCFNWQGLDGSALAVIREAGGVEMGTHVCNLPMVYTIQERMRASLENICRQPGDVLALFCSEEGVLSENIFAETARLNDAKEIRFATAEEFAQTVDTDKLPVFAGEFNPEFTGCYTTRSRLKRLNREAEHALLSGEKISALCTLFTGNSGGALAESWNRLFYCQFHDGICGCHAETVYDEMQNWYREILLDGNRAQTRGFSLLAEKSGEQPGALLFNPTLGERQEVALIENRGAPVDGDGNNLPCQRDGDKLAVKVKAPSFGFATVRYADPGKIEATKISNGKATQKNFDTGAYELDCTSGSLRIKTKGLRAPVLPETGLGEIWLREERGDLWTEELCGVLLDKNMTEETIERVEEGPVFTHVSLRGKILPKSHGFGAECIWDGFYTLEWDRELTFYRDEARIDLKVTLRLRGNNTQVGVSFPLQIDPLTARPLYSVPFGCMERKPYYEVPQKLEATVGLQSQSVLQKAKGDWPALYWTDYSDRNGGMTLANRGVAGQQLKDGTIYASLLRSPTKMASHYTPDAGAWDNGQHVYEFSLLPHEGGFAPECAAFGEAFNHPLCVHETTGLAPENDLPRGTLLAVDQANIALSAFKQAEDGDGYILRLYETCGQGCEAKLSVNLPVREILEVGMDETGGEKIDPASLTFSPFEIKTLRLG